VRQYTHPLLCLLALLIVCGGGCYTGKRFPPLKAFLKANYTHITGGLPVELPEPITTIPDLQPGTAIAFYCTATNAIRSLLCAEPLIVELAQPITNETITAGIEGVDVRSATSTVVITKATAAALMESTKGSTTLLGDTDGIGSLSTARSGAELLSASGIGDLESARSGEIMSQDDRDGGFDTVSTLGELPDLATVDADFTSVRAGAETAPDAIVEQQFDPITERGSRKIDVRAGLGNFGELVDSRNVNFFEGIDIIAWLTDQNILDGIYGDLDQITIFADADLIDGDEEIAILRALQGSITVSNLVNRPLSDGYRVGGRKIVGPTYESTMSIAEVGAEGYYHGTEVLFSLQIANTGTVPLYDLVVLSGLPAHTEFTRFPVVETRERGFLHFYLRDKKLLAWKVYKPVNPGETFKATFALRLDNWDVSQMRP